MNHFPSVEKKTFSILKCFEQQAEKNANKTALCFQDEVLSYQELNEKANQLARWIRLEYFQIYGREMMPDTIIGLCVDRGLEMVISIIAILKAGGAYLPLEPIFLNNDINEMIGEAQETLLLVQKKFSDYLHTTVPVIRIENVLGANKFGTTNLDLLINSSNLACVIYTSGTTGKPKGVAVEHQQVASLFVSVQSYFHFTEKDTWTLFHASSADPSVWEMWGALLHGGRLVIVPDICLEDSTLFYQLIWKQQVTVMTQTPTSFMRYLENDQVYGNVGSSALKYIIVGGEKLHFAKIKNWLEVWKGKIKLINVYGVTEASILSTCYFLNIENAKVTESLIGKPIPGTDIYLLDDQMQLVPQGSPGEMYISGPGVARGYHNRPELTKERFMDNPWKPGERMYRTGDLAYRRSDGNLVYLERKDRQVKVSGFRIETGQIESILCQHECVSQAVVTVYQKNENEKALAAYMVSKRSLDAQEKQEKLNRLRVHCVESLPYYMVPYVFMWIDHIPLTTNGKTDYRQLPDPLVGNRTLSDDRPKEALNPTQAALIGIWEEILDYSNASLDDSFFEYGGNSIKAMRIRTRVHELLGYHCFIPTLFKYPTVRELANHLQHLEDGKQEHFKIYEKGDETAASFAQEELWFLHHYGNRKSAVYNESVLFHLSGVLDEIALRKSVELLIERHSSLRTWFIMKNGTLFQKIEPVMKVEWSQEDKADLGINHDFQRALTENVTLASRINEVICKAFNLEKGPLFRLCLLRLGEKSSLLLLVFHHIIMDGWTLPLILNDLSKAYNAFRNDTNPDFKPLTVQYADYALWQKEQPLDSAKKFWKSCLKNWKPLHFPLDYVRPAQQTFDGARHYFTLSSEAISSLTQLAKKRHVTLFTVMLAAFNVLLYRYTRQTDILIGIPSSYRPHRELEEIVGYFVNLLPLRSDLNYNPRFDYLLRLTKDSILQAQLHQILPFKTIIQTADVTYTTDRSPLVQIVLVYHALTEQPELLLSDLKAAQLIPEHHTSKFDWTFCLQETADGLSGYIEYNTALFKPESIHQIVLDFEALLSCIVGNPQQYIDDLAFGEDSYTEGTSNCTFCFSEAGILPSSLPVSESARSSKQNAQFEVDRVYNDSASKTLIQIFEEQVEKYPDNIALIEGENTLSYQELNQKANQLARRLCAQYQEMYSKDIIPDTLIGLCAGRNMEMVIGIIAILKAGGAYLPLDPALSMSYLNALVEEAQPALLLVEEKWLSDCADLSVPHLCIEVALRESSELSTQRTQVYNPGCLLGPSSLAYVIYTSGTTGKPKGVPVQHDHVCRLFSSVQDYFHFNEKDVWTLFHSFAFDFSVWEIWGALLHGGRLVLVSYMESRDPALFYQLVQEHKVTVMNQTPRAFLSYMQEDLQHPAGQQSLRYIIFGGEKLVFSKLQPWFERWGDKKPQLVNMYGITEITVHGTYYALDNEDCYKNESIIGVPLQDLAIYLLDEDRQLVSEGSIGEMYIGGAGVAKGYWKYPELTLERFIDNPWKAGEKLYRSGDLAYRLPSGHLVYVGRADKQVKVRGFRVEPEEIEQTLLLHPKIEKAFVTARESVQGHLYLVAYFVCYAGEKLNSSEVHQFASSQLPPHKVPAFFVEIADLPLNNNGKIDEKKLPEPTVSSQVADETPVIAELTDLEAMLTAIWCQVLGRKFVGIDDNFFSIGGDSIRAVQIIYDINQKNGHSGREKIFVKDILTYQTIRTLANYMESLQSVNHQAMDKTVSIDLLKLPDDIIEEIQRQMPDDVEDVYPASSMQKLMLYHYAHNTQEQPVYHTQERLRITDKDFSPRAFCDAISHVIAAHAPLRAVFCMKGEEPVQVIKKHGKVFVPIVDMRHEDPETQEQLIKQSIKEDAHFDDLQAPLFRFCLFCISDDEFEFLISIHHAIEDGWSHVEFLRELFSLYQTLKVSDIAIVPKPNVHKEHIALEKVMASSKEAQSFWKNHLEKAVWPVLKKNTVLSLEPHFMRVLDEKISRGLLLLAQKLQVSVKTIFLSALNELMEDSLKQSFVPIGVVSNGRSEKLSDPIHAQGLFWNIVPFVSTGQKDKVKQIQMTQNVLNSIEPYIHYPYSGEWPFISTFNFTWFHNTKELPFSDAFKVKRLSFHDKFHYPINWVISVEPLKESITLRIEYDATYFSFLEIQEKAEKYIGLLESWIVL